MKTGKLSKLIENKPSRQKDAPRKYIGASVIGSECWRAIWYSLHDDKFKRLEISPRLQRIFDTGHRLEELVKDWLEEGGLRIYRDFREVMDFEYRYFRGHIDCALLDKYGDIIGLIEIKTAKDSEFKKFVKHGLKKWHPSYYAQVQSYMGMSKVDQTYELVVNKDTSHLADELIIFDPKHYDALRQKARGIQLANTEPPRISSSPVWWQCKMCDFKEVCHNDK